MSYFKDKFKDDFIIIAGPCSIENQKMILQTAVQVKTCGGNVIRGGAFKPRTSPLNFQGLGEEGLKYLQEASYITGLPVVSEVMDARDIELVSKYVDILQVGSRNMQNYSLLKELGLIRKPILLKRGLSATIDEYIGAIEYISIGGNEDIILCERGIRTFDNKYTRNTLDLASVVILKQLTDYPVIVDPSHGTGRKDLILPMALASIPIGANGVMIEIHPKDTCFLLLSQSPSDIIYRGGGFATPP